MSGANKGGTGWAGGGEGCGGGGCVPGGSRCGRQAERLRVAGDADWRAGDDGECDTGWLPDALPYLQPIRAQDGLSSVEEGQN